MIKEGFDYLNTKLSKPEGIFFAFAFIGMLSIISYITGIKQYYFGFALLILFLILEIARIKSRRKK